MATHLLLGQLLILLLLLCTSLLLFVPIIDASVSSFSCDFDKDLCEYSTSRNSPLPWKQHQGEKKGHRPDKDHTGTGSFVYIETSDSGGGAGQTSSLRSGSIEYDPGQFCLQFWYHVYGKSLGKLSVDLEVQGRGPKKVTPMWHTTDIHANTWRFAEADFTLTNEERRIVFTGTLGPGSPSGIALDDVIAVNGHCDLPDNCNFDDHCRWRNIENKEFNWKRCQKCSASNLQPTSDHTGNGNYMYITSMANDKKSSERATLVSDFITPQKSVCFQFYYYLQGSEESSLSVSMVTYDRHLDDSLERTHKTFWYLPANQPGGWKAAAIPLSSPLEEFKIQIQAEVASDKKGSFLAIDDTSFNNQGAKDCILAPPQAKPVGQPAQLGPGSDNTWMAPVFTILAILIVGIIAVVAVMVVRKRRMSEDNQKLEEELKDRPPT